jgi:hypothetical protein
MSTVEKVYFVAAWAVAGCALLSLILLAVAARGSGLLAASAAFDGLFVGTAACFMLLYFSGWFRNGLVLFIVAWGVAGFAFLSMIFAAAAGFGALYTVGTLFWHIALGAFSTFVLLHLSGKLEKGKTP